MLEATLLLCWVSFPFTLHFVSCVSTVRSSCSDIAHTHTLAQTDSQIHTDTHTLIPIAVCETFNYEICINNVVGCPYVDVFMYTDLTMRANLFSHVHTQDCVRSTTHILTNQQMYNTKLSAMFAMHIATHYTSTCVHMYWVHVHDQKGKYRHTEYTHTEKKSKWLNLTWTQATDKIIERHERETLLKFFVLNLFCCNHFNFFDRTWIQVE